MVGDFLREPAALIVVLWPLEDGMKNERISGTVMVFSLLSASILVYWGIILEQGRTMSIFGSWIVTVAFCFIVFLVGKHSK